MKLIVGLGNPGGDYRFTRHNAGFWVIDTFLSRHKKKTTRSKHQSQAISLVLSGEEVWFLKPQTYMNLSGECVAPFARDIGAEPADTLVVHDEADMEPNRLQLKKGGGSGGHKGLESIFARWGTRDFLRLRVGIGKDPERDLSDYALEDVPEELLQTLGKRGADALDLLFSVGPEKATNQINSEKTPSI